MHELSLTQTLLEAVLQHAAKNNAKRVVTVNLLIGQLSDENVDSVKFYWDDLSKGTLAHEAQLDFKSIPGEFICMECGYHFQSDHEVFVCPVCSKAAVRVSGGDDLRLESIDIE